MNRRPRPTQSRGYTLMELMVAIGITVMLMVLVQQLFRETTRAVNIGVQTSQILTQAEAISTQIERDANRMLGPSESENGPAGYLVIINRRIVEDLDGDELHIRSRRSAEIERIPNLEAEADGPEEKKARGYRADQIIFIAGDPDDTPPLAFRSLTPKRIDTLGSDIEARFARVWLGHAVQLRPNEAVPDLDNAPWLGQRETRNEWPNDWTLARHALLLAERRRGNFPDPPPPSMIFAGLARWDAEIPAYGSARRVYHSLTDVADQPLRRLSPEDDPGVLDEIEDQEQSNNGNYVDLAGHSAIPQLNPASEFRVFVSQIPHREDFRPFRLAQMHPVLSGHVSDFIVEFAGDFNGDGEIDRHDDNGNVIWYSHFRNDPEDGPPRWGDDRFSYDAARPVATSARDLDGEPRAPVHATGNNPPPSSGSHQWYYWDINDNTAVFVWRHDDAGASDSDEPSMWPHLIRIRYRLQDPRGDVRSAVQYIDENGEQASEDQPGQWFEQIIAVPRP